MTVYLIHFDRAIGDISKTHGSAGHYIGVAKDLNRRLAEHASGQGAAIMAELHRRGISWRLARTWRGGRKLERRLKKYKGANRLCPLCNATAMNHMKGDPDEV